MRQLLIAISGFALAAGCSTAEVSTPSSDPANAPAPSVETPAPPEPPASAMETSASADVTCSPEIIMTRSVKSQNRSGQTLRRNVRVWKEGDVVGFTSIMQVNADGAPDAYTPDGDGLSFTCDGALAFEDGACVSLSDSQWQTKCNAAFKASIENDWDAERLCVFGWEMEGGRQGPSGIVGGKPLIQGPSDPAPGNFVSATAMTIAGAPEDSQARYLNSREIPFFVLPPWLQRPVGADVGVNSTVGIIRRAETNKLAPAVAGDTGPRDKLGEGSIALHTALGSTPIIRNYRGSGIDRARRNILDDLDYVMFPTTRVRGDLDHDTFRNRIADEATAAFDAWGGEAKLDACLATLEETP